MSKIAFTKLGLKRNEEIKVVEWNGQKIEVPQFLPTYNKIDLITKIIAFSADDHNFYNPCKIDVVEKVLTILEYTNINLTEKQGEDMLKLHDLFVSSGFYDAIISVIPEVELAYIHTGVIETIKEIYRYKTSIHGILSTIAEDYKDTNFDVQKILSDLSSNKEGLENLKEIVTNLD